MIAVGRTNLRRSNRPSASSSSVHRLAESEWDIVVIGAGPAGSSAAIEIAKTDRSVLLLDAKKFPRTKVCGGCLNRPAITIIESLLGVEHPIWGSAAKLDRFELHDRHRVVNLPLPTGFAIDRSILDQALVDQAVELGVTFVDGESATLPPILSTEIDGWRRVQIGSGSETSSVKAKCVIVAVGLGNAFKATIPNLENCDEILHPIVANGSRVGLAIEACQRSAEHPQNTIVMSVANEGYVGSTSIGSGRVHIAAAVEMSALRRLGPKSLVEKILVESGSEAINFNDGRWLGTPELTRRAGSLSGYRVFMIGDAAKYVEPFTGEGIHWALKSGVGLAQVIESEPENWSVELGRRWERWHRDHIQPSQRICRGISFGLRSGIARTIAGYALRWQPQLANLFIEKINKY